MSGADWQEALMLCRRIDAKTGRIDAMLDEINLIFDRMESNAAAFRQWQESRA